MKDISTSFVLSTKVLLSLVICFVTLAYGDNYQVTILHTNDIHSRIEQTNKYLGVCSKKDQGISWNLYFFWYLTYLDFSPVPYNFLSPFCRCKAKSKMLRWYGAIDEYSKNYPAKCTKRNFFKWRRYVSRQRLVQPIQVENNRSIHQLLEFYSIGKIGSKQFYKS